LNQDDATTATATEHAGFTLGELPVVIGAAEEQADAVGGGSSPLRQLLVQAGNLTGPEATVMVALLELRTATLKQLSEATHIARADIRSLLDQLYAKGLCQRLSGMQAVWECPEPKEILGRLRRAEEARLQAALETAARSFDQAEAQLTASGETDPPISFVDDARLGVFYVEAMESVDSEVLVLNRGPYPGEVEPDPAVLDALARGVRARAEVSLGPLADLVDKTTPITARVLTGQVRGGRTVLSAADGSALVVVAAFGAGRVVQLAYDPQAPNIESDPVVGPLAWEQGLSRALNPWGSGIEPLENAVAPEEQLWTPVLEPARWPVWPPAARWVLGGYLFAVCSVAGLATRRSTSARAALGLVALVVLAGGAVCFAGLSGSDTVENEIVIKTSSVDGTVSTTSYRSVRQLRPAPTLTSGPGAATSRFIEAGATRPFLVQEFGLPSAPALRGRGRGIIEVRDGTAKLEQPVRPWEPRTVQHTTISGNGEEVEAHLSLVGITEPPVGGIRIRGRITNHGPHTLRQVRVQLPEGGQAQVAEALAAGASIDIDAPIVWISHGSVEKGQEAPPIDRLLFAAASRSFTGAGQAVVVAEDAAASTATTQRRSTTIVVSATPLEHADRFTTPATILVAGLTGAGGNSLSIYDYETTPGHAALSIGYTPAPELTRVEVYDWSARTWRSLPTTATRPPSGPQPTTLAPLNPSESNQGIIRIRAAPTLWGLLRPS